MSVYTVAGPLLKPHVSEIVHVLVDSLTQLEPQDFNYLALHADKDSQRVLEVRPHVRRH
jgi:hypothetical protein